MCNSRLEREPPRLTNCDLRDKYDCMRLRKRPSDAKVAYTINCVLCIVAVSTETHRTNLPRVHLRKQGRLNNKNWNKQRLGLTSQTSVFEMSLLAPNFSNMKHSIQSQTKQPLDDTQKLLTTCRQSYLGENNS